MEDQLIRKIKGGIFAIKNGTKTPQTANLGIFFNKLKEINKPMYDELMNNYKSITKQ
jgi:hypothetical protein